jgi:outer membrane protein TolC
VAALVAGATLAWGASAEELQLTLTEAQAHAVEHNARLVGARAQVGAAEAWRMQTGSGYLPSLRLSQGWARTNDPVNAFGVRLKQGRFTQEDFAVERLNDPDDISNWQTKLDVQQPIFDGIASWSRRSEAGASVMASEAELELQTLEVRFETARAYWALVLANEALRTVRERLETTRAHARDAEARHGQETIGLSDLLAAQLRVVELEEETILAESRVATAVETLTLVMGLNASTRLVARDSLATLADVADVDTLVQTAARQRPDLRAAEHRAAAARAAASAARGGYWPRLDAFASAEINTQDFGDRDGDSWSFGGLLSWDLWSGGRIRGGHREARSHAAAMAARVGFETQRAEREVRQAHREVQAARKRVVVADTALDLARERLRVVSLQVEEDVATTTDFLAAQDDETQARLRRMQALHDLNVGVARLDLVVGGP